MCYKANIEKKRVDTEKEAQNYDQMNDFDKKKFQDEEGSRFVSYVVFAVFLGIFTLLFLIGVCCAKESLQRAIDVIDASADYVAHNKRVIIVPNLHYAITAIVTLIWLGAFLCVFSLN